MPASSASRVILGVSAIPRYAGFAVVVDGQPWLLPTLRFRRRLTVDAAKRRVERALARHLRHHRPAAIALDRATVMMANESEVVRGIVDAIESAGRGCRLGTLVVSREEVRYTLELPRTSAIGIVRGLAKLLTRVGVDIVTRERGRRSEHERHREPGLVALACALSIAGGLRTPHANHANHKTS